MALKNLKISLLFIGILFSLAACGVEKAPQLVIPATPTPTDEIQKRVSTPEPTKVLSICLGAEPRSLFLYGDNSFPTRVIRQTIFDGPVDRVDFDPTPVILEGIPSPENGDVRVDEVQVPAGETLVDASGNVTYLAEGVTYRPAGCFSAECEKTFKEGEGVTLDQVTIRYRIRPDVKWADGEPLQADDSVYSFQVAGELYGEFGPPELRYAQNYVQRGETLVEWRGIPGYQGFSSYADYFFTPLPRHRWQNVNPLQLASDERARKYPLGWGPFIVEEWRAGEHITLSRNDHYFRQEGGIPFYDHVVFRFLGEGQSVMDAFQAGECEVALGVPDLMGKISTLEEREADGELNVIHLYGGAWEQAVFGIRSRGARQSLFQDPRTRQAIAKCVDRQEIVSHLAEAPRVAHSYYPAQHPAFNEDMPKYRYDPTDGMALLEEVGWMDTDGNPGTPRQAQGVEGVDDGTLFQFQLLISQSGKSAEIGRLIKEHLAGCSIQVDAESLPAGELLAAGLEGPVFGRSFDMAQFAWTPGDYQLCSLFLSTEIPGPYPAFPKGWGGGNAPGYENEAFDVACKESIHLLPDHERTLEAQKQAQEIFAEDLPVLPLYFRQDIMLADLQLSGLFDGFFTPLWNIENLP